MGSPSDEKLSCAICQEEVIEPAKFIPCNHAYHLGCVQRWLTVGATCPVCRSIVEKLEDATGIVEHADSYLGRTPKQLEAVLEQSSGNASESSFEESSQSSSDSYSVETSSSSSVSRSRLDIESSSSYSEESDSEDQPKKRKARRDASPKQRKK
jgi:hypothetical protein